jgi:hypothetical protein
MDSGDANGDVYFGLAQLVLPQLCVEDPGFLWCQNRKFLSDGAAHMVTILNLMCGRQQH